MFGHIRNKVEGAISGKRIKDIANAIYAHDRWFSFPEFEKSIHYCRGKMEEYGLNEIRIIQYPADGKTILGDYLMPLGWEAVDAELWILEPEYAKRRIASYKEVPTSLFMYSAPTPSSGVKAEVVIIEGDYEDESILGDVENKIVFISNRLDFHFKYKLIKGKALGVLNDWRMDFDQGEGVHWENHRLYPNLDQRLFGFSINREAGLYLRNIIKKESQEGKKVKLWAKVKTHLYEGKIETLTGLIPGKDEKEDVLTFAHLFEQGAWDNASGVSVILEVSKILNSLIKTGKLERPRRSIRFLMGWECYGLMSYLLSNPQRIPHIVGGLNIDGVGVEPTSPEIVVQLCSNPHSHSNYSDTLLKWIITELASENKFRLPWKQVPFLPCSDQLPSDPYFKIPFPLIYQPCPEIWHSSSDTQDKLSSDVLEQICLAATVYLYFLASANHRDAKLLAKRIVDEAEQDLCGMRLKKTKEETYSELAEQLEYKGERYIEAFNSTARLVDEKDQKRYVLSLADMSKKLKAKFKTKKYSYPPLNSWDKEAALLVPERVVPGFLTLKTLPQSVKEKCKWGPGYQVLVEPIMWVDGKRNLLQISRLLRQEVGEAEPENLIDCFKFLERYGYVKLRRKECPEI